MSDQAMQSVPTATAKATYIRIAPRKVQIVLDLIRNQPADKAMAILKYTPKAACEPLMKLLKSAMANAENNHNMNKDDLYVSECFVCPGPIMKRVMPRAQDQTQSSGQSVPYKQKDFTHQPCTQGNGISEGGG